MSESQDYSVSESETIRTTTFGDRFDVLPLAGEGENLNTFVERLLLTRAGSFMYDLAITRDMNLDILVAVIDAFAVTSRANYCHVSILNNEAFHSLVQDAKKLYEG